MEQWSFVRRKWRRFIEDLMGIRVKLGGVSEGVGLG